MPSIEGTRRPDDDVRRGRLSVRPGPPVAAPAGVGLVPLAGPGGEPLALTYVAPTGDGGPYRLVLLLHGAGGSPRQALDLLLPVADEHRLLLVAPRSTAATWDMIGSGFGPDVRRIDRVLRDVLAACPVAGASIGGFSDGASYALSLGLANGDVFGAVLAFSPGFAAPPAAHGRPRVYVSHGTGDRVLPIGACSRRLVPRLRAGGYDVTYDEFDGGHEVPGPIVRRALRWLGDDG
jgi:predicted esterase